MRDKKRLYQAVLTALLSSIILILALVPNLGYILIPPGVAVTIVHIPVLIGIFLVDRKNSLVLGFVFGASSLLTALIRGVSPLDLAFINPLISILPRILFAYLATFIIDLFKRINNIKNGNIYMFILVSLITGFGLYFGLNSFLNANASEGVINVFRYITPVIILLFIAFYAYFIFKKYSKNSYIPAVIIISTFIHTILVIGAIVLFKPTAFYESFGTNDSVIKIILMIAVANGLLEAIIGAVIASPIAVAVLLKKEGEE